MYCQKASPLMRVLALVAMLVVGISIAPAHAQRTAVRGKPQTTRVSSPRPTTRTRRPAVSNRRPSSSVSRNRGTRTVRVSSNRGSRDRVTRVHRGTDRRNYVVRSNRNVRHYGYGYDPGYYNHHYYSSLFFPITLGYFGYPWWHYYRYYYHPYAYPYYGGYWHPYRAYAYDADSGAIDLNVKPRRTQVYLDGSPIGKVTQYDGWPGHLWLKKGKYELIFVLDGHETVRKVYDVQPGVTIRERFRMVNGQSTPAAELSDPPKKPQVRIRDTAGEGGAVRRYDYERPRREVEPPPPREAGPVAEESSPIDLRGEPATLMLTVTPGDASVYIDSQFVGTGNALSLNESGLLLDPGEHEIEILRPGYAALKRTITVKPGQQLTLDLDLEKN